MKELDNKNTNLQHKSALKSPDRSRRDFSNVLSLII
jgi:hypothetical protein